MDIIYKLFWIHLIILHLADINIAEKSYIEINNEFSTTNPNEVFKFSSNINSTRYLLYSVNPGEGFNLRRDVFIRMVNLVTLLNKNESWVLVLPSWGRMYHWRTMDVYEEVKGKGGVDWSVFFDIPSINLLCPVMEQSDFVKALKGEPIENIVYLQRYEEGWSGGDWVEKIDVRPCLTTNTPYEQDKADGLWHWGVEGLASKKHHCLSIQAEYSTLVNYLTNNITSRSIMISRAEMVIHGQYSEWSRQYWTARRSMRFSGDLCGLADEFRRKYLNSDDVADGTVMEKDWRDMKRKSGDAKGGEYLGVHLRRRDFTHSHANSIPSLEGAAKQISEALEKLKLSKVFIATDAPNDEYQKLKKKINADVFRFKATSELLEQYKDGGIAIIDQWICAHAKHFIGTKTSTFSFRIHEEREILGFSQSSTYNGFCSDKEKACEQPSKWPIIY